MLTGTIQKSGKTECLLSPPLIEQFWDHRQGVEASRVSPNILASLVIDRTCMHVYIHAYLFQCVYITTQYCINLSCPLEKLHKKKVVRHLKINWKKKSLVKMGLLPVLWHSWTQNKCLGMKSMLHVFFLFANFELCGCLLTNNNYISTWSDVVM